MSKRMFLITRHIAYNLKKGAYDMFGGRLSSLATLKHLVPRTIVVITTIIVLVMVVAIVVVVVLV